MASRGSPHARRRSSDGLIWVGLAASLLAALIGVAAIGDFEFDMGRPSEVKVVIILPPPAVTVAKVWQEGQVRMPKNIWPSQENFNILSSIGGGGAWLL